MVKFNIDSVSWPGLSKIIEETSELNTVIAKLMATEGNKEYWEGVNLLDSIEEELGDTLAAILFTLKHNADINNFYVLERMQKKLNLYEKWRNEQCV
jgi:NTP pyrophosphatase (non-canonical NTP hydrolase)